MKTLTGKLSLAATLALGVGLILLAAYVSYWFIPAYLLVGSALCWRAIPQLPRRCYSRFDATLIYVAVSFGWVFLAGTCLVFEWGMADRELTLVQYVHELFI